jgi:hypothetical protein
MNDRLTVPGKIKVGFQNRSDTYTGKLAYVIYYDNKGKLRKETSWEGWRDKKIDPIEYDNEPTSGFVLNKDVGGSHRSYDWNARREKVRVFDPRNFEFEISVENLLFVLQESSSIKGKGLEGEFVYSWSGTELILLPISSQEYSGSVNFCKLQDDKVAAKDVEVGCTYLNKDKKEVMYLGRHDWLEKKVVRGVVKRSYYGGERKEIIGYDTKCEKRHVFVIMNTKEKGKYRYWIQSGFTKLAKRITDKPIQQYAEEYENLMKTGFTSHPIKIVFGDEPVKMPKTSWDYTNSIGLIVNEICFLGSIRQNYRSMNSPMNFDIDCRTILEVKDDVFQQRYVTSDGDGFIKAEITEEVVRSLVKPIYVEYDNGAKLKVEN